MTTTLQKFEQHLDIFASKKEWYEGMGCIESEETRRVTGNTENLGTSRLFETFRELGMNDNDVIIDSGDGDTTLEQFENLPTELWYLKEAILNGEPNSADEFTGFDCFENPRDHVVAYGDYNPSIISYQQLTQSEDLAKTIDDVEERIGRPNGNCAFCNAEQIWTLIPQIAWAIDGYMDTDDMSTPCHFTLVIKKGYLEYVMKLMANELKELAEEEE